MRYSEKACICRGIEISRDSVQNEKFREVLWSSACNYAEAKHGIFVPYYCTFTKKLVHVRLFSRNRIKPGRNDCQANMLIQRGVGGTQLQHSISKAVVKHDGVWSRRGWVTASCWALHTDDGQVSPEYKMRCRLSLPH